MSLNWTKVTPTTRRASANGREYRIISASTRFLLRINDVEQRFDASGRTRASLTECYRNAEEDAERHNKGKRTEGEQRPDPSPSPSGSPVPSTPTNPCGYEDPFGGPCRLPPGHAGPHNDRPVAATSAPTAPGISAAEHPGTGSPDPGDVTDDGTDADDTGPADPNPVEAGPASITPQTARLIS